MYDNEITDEPIDFTEVDVEDLEEYAEVPELVAAYDPSILDDIEEMVADYDEFLFRDEPGLTYLSDENVSLDLTDQIDWDSVDYE